MVLIVLDLFLDIMPTGKRLKPVDLNGDLGFKRARFPYSSRW